MKLSLLVRSDALKVTSALSHLSKEIGESLQILASGSRFTHPGADPADQAFASRLQLDIRKATAAISNGSSGLEATNMAADGISEIILVLTRMKEIATTGASSLLHPDQRSALASEFTLLSSEADRIAASTEFNTFKMLSHSSELSIQVGIGQVGIGGSASQHAIIVPRTLATLESIGLRSGSGSITVSITGATASAAATAAENAINPIEAAIESLTNRRAALYGADRRIETAVDQMRGAREIYQSSLDTITAPDYAQELTRITRLQLLADSATALLAQANLDQKRVLELLK